MYYPLPSWPVLYLYTGVTAFVLSAFLMPLAIRILLRRGVVDAPEPGKIHERPTPRGGGVAMFIAFAIAVILPNYRDHPMKGVLIGGFLCLLVGLADDLRGGVPAVIKLGTLSLATLIMAWFGVSLQIFESSYLNLALTLLWIVGVTSAFNGIDNMDGLASGVAVIVSAMYVIIAVDAFYEVGTETPISWFGLLGSALIGSNLGFLLYNYAPARIFMGDSGSFFLGFTLAALGVMGEWNEQPVIAVTIPVLILGIPIFDFLYILIARVLRGDTKSVREVIEHCSTDHLSHRLLWMGFSRRRAVWTIYVMCLVMGIAGILLRNSERVLDSILALVQGGAVVFLIVVLMAGTEGRRAMMSLRRGEAVPFQRAEAAEDDDAKRKSA